MRFVAESPAEVLLPALCGLIRTCPGWHEPNRKVGRYGSRSEHLKNPLPATVIWWEAGGPKHTNCFYRLDHFKLPESLTSGQGEVDLNCCFYFDRLAIQQIRLVLPLLHSFDRRRGQHGMSADQMQIFDRAILADFSL